MIFLEVNYIWIEPALVYAVNYLARDLCTPFYENLDQPLYLARNELRPGVSSYYTQYGHYTKGHCKCFAL